jgi:alpha-beta hydrolase superfamily lysophospholipase
MDMFARVLLHISLGTWTLFGPSGFCAATETDPFVIGFQIESKVLAETRTYVIHTPASYQSGKEAYLPTVDRDYRTRPYRVLIGHSLGGLFARYALMNRPEVFNGYLIISPSLWWDDQALVKAAQPHFAAHKDLRADLYMTMGSEGEAM